MCGILVVAGPDAHLLVSNGVVAMQHRGPDETVIRNLKSVCLGFVRLSINGSGSDGRQPFSSGAYHCLINGEIFNHQELKETYKIEQSSASDTSLVLPIYQLLGNQFIGSLDGFFSGIIFDEEKQRLICFRDHIGKKPLYSGKYGENVFVCSELKSIPGYSSFSRVPKGLSTINLETGKPTAFQEKHEYPTQLNSDLRTIIVQSVVKRIPSRPIKFGVFISGGLDSSIVASIVKQHCHDAIYYSLTNEASSDYRSTRKIAQHLQIELRTVPLPTTKELTFLIEQVVVATESYNPSFISNGIATYLLAQAAHKDGLKVVLSGEGADEVFMGYHMLTPNQDWERIRSNLIANLYFTELRRLDSCAMAHGIEARCPFLDQEVLAFTNQLSYQDFYQVQSGDLINKAVLRNVFSDDLPGSIVQRNKISLDVGSGIRKLVVEYLTSSGGAEIDVLREIWKRNFNDFDENEPHFFAYPIMDKAIARRGIYHE